MSKKPKIYQLKVADPLNIIYKTLNKIVKIWIYGEGKKNLLH